MYISLVLFRYNRKACVPPRNQQKDRHNSALYDYVEEHMLSCYTGIKPDLHKRYMDDVAGAASCSEEELRQFLEFASSFHPNLEYTWSVSTDKLPFLDICMKPHYKATDSHSYLNFSSSHPYSCKSSIPYSQFLRLRKICSDDPDFDIEAAKMETFFCRTRISE